MDIVNQAKGENHFDYLGPLRIYCISLLLGDYYDFTCTTESAATSHLPDFKTITLIFFETLRLKVKLAQGKIKKKTKLGFEPIKYCDLKIRSRGSSL